MDVPVLFGVAISLGFEAGSIEATTVSTDVKS
jgi:hypothetical protein